MILLSFLKKEIKQLVRNKKMAIAIFVFPVIQIIIMGFSITSEPKNIRMAVDCPANDYVIQNVYSRAIASGWFRDIPSTRDSPFRSIQTGKADVAVVSPEGGFTKSLVNGNPKLQILIDASNVVKAQSVEAYMRSIISSVAKDFRLSPFVNQPSIHFKARVLFNPEMKTPFFIIPFIMAILIAMVILSTTCTSIAKEKEMGTIETLISAPIAGYQIILGKTIPYIFVALINIFVVLFIGMTIFGLPFIGSMTQFLLSFVVFAISISAFSVLLSTVCDTQQQAMLAMMIFLFLSVILSGGLTPIDNMPSFLKVIANIMPLSHYVYLLRNLLLKGGELSYCLYHNSAIACFGIISVILAVKKFKTTL